MTNTTASMPYDWLKQIPTSLLQLDEIPLIGLAPSFPWEELSKGIGEIFQIPDFKIEPLPAQWRTQEELFSGMGDLTTHLTCVIPSLEGSLCWIMPTDDVRRLMSLLLNDSYHEHDVLEDEFLQGFHYFAAYEVIHLLTKLPFGASLSPQIQKDTPLPNEPSLCIDTKIHLRGKVLIGRIIISPSLRRAWKERHAERSLELPIHSSLAEKLTLPVHIEAGRTSLKPSEWKTIHPGDVILLDTCTVRPYDEKGGRVTLTVNGMPFYIGKIKDGNIKILDHPLYYQEEETSMSNHPTEDHPDEQEDSSFDFETESDLESEHEEDSEVGSEESSMESEQESEELSEESKIPSEEESIEENLEEESLGTPEAAAETPFNIEEIPLSIVIEVGRLQMSIKKILELQPGNLLELDVHPENGVDLVVNGKRIAKGELVKLGEALGVRILDIS